MGLLGLLSRSGKSRAVRRLELILHQNIGLKLVNPSAEILSLLQELSDRDLGSFETIHSVEGMQELFRVKSIQAIVNRNLNLVSLFPLSDRDKDVETSAKSTPNKILHVSHRSTPVHRIIAEEEPTLGSTPNDSELEAKDEEEISDEFQHLSSVEQLCVSIVDLLVKHGQLSISDREILKRHNPLNGTVESRIATLEHWQIELSRRVRAFQTPKLTQSLILEDATEKKDKENENPLVARFDQILIWLGKFIKAFEGTGARFHNKPVWLPR